MKLFPRDKTVGIFRGFSEGGLELGSDNHWNRKSG
jgi:hypothetical protein